MRNRGLILIIGAVMLGGLMIAAVCLIMFLQPDVVTVLHHAEEPGYTKPAWDEVKHSRDVILLPFAMLSVLGATLIAGFVASELRDET